MRRLVDRESATGALESALRTTTIEVQAIDTPGSMGLMHLLKPYGLLNPTTDGQWQENDIAQGMVV